MGTHALTDLPAGGSMDDLFHTVSANVLPKYENGTEDPVGNSNYGIRLHHLQIVSPHNWTSFI